MGARRFFGGSHMQNPDPHKAQRRYMDALQALTKEEADAMKRNPKPLEGDSEALRHAKQCRLDAADEQGVDHSDKRNIHFPV